MSTVTLPAVRETEVESERSIKEGLQKALDLLREEGWCQHQLENWNYDGGKSRCMLGATWAVMEDDPIYYIKMALALVDALGETPGPVFCWSHTHSDGAEVVYMFPSLSAVARWNDSPERSQAQVEMIFEHAISKAES